MSIRHESEICSFYNRLSASSVGAIETSSVVYYSYICSLLCYIIEVYLHSAMFRKWCQCCKLSLFVAVVILSLRALVSLCKYRHSYRSAYNYAYIFIPTLSNIPPVIHKSDYFGLRRHESKIFTLTTFMHQTIQSFCYTLSVHSLVQLFEYLHRQLFSLVLDSLIRLKP